MHFTSLFTIASTLLSIVFALPVAVSKDQSLSKSSTDVGSDVIPSLARRFEVESDELLDRAFSDHFNRANIIFAPSAEKNLKNLHLPSKNQDTKARRYNIHLVDSHLRVNGLHDAHTVVIRHIAHVGGSNPQEPLHATVVIRDKNKRAIESNFRGPNGDKVTVHHVYPIPGEHWLPPKYAKAERSRARAKGLSTKSIV